MRCKTFVTRLLNRFRRSPIRSEPRRELVLGTRATPNGKELVVLAAAMRPMHVGFTGLTGTGKTYFLENLIRQDIDQETGCVVFDVHGDLADSIVAYLAEQAVKRPHIRDRIVLIEPFDPDYSIGFNPLEVTGHTSPYLQAQEMARILRARWETHSFGARTEELLRTALYTLSVSSLTLLELPALLINKGFRNELVKTLRDPAVVDYWKGRYDPLSEPMKATVREPLLNRLSAFLADPQIRHIVGQRRSTFSFGDAMHDGLWVIINLSQGKLGEENSAVLGSLLFTSLVLKVMARARIPESGRELFAVYADELQNLAGHNFAKLVAEARKYRVSVVAGHQFWDQLSPQMRAAMLGVGSRVFFRLHYHDAARLAPEIDARHKDWATLRLTTLDRGQAIFRTGAEPAVEFQVPLHDVPQATPADIRRLKDESRLRYATPLDAIRSDIEQRYRRRSEAQVAEDMKKRKASRNRPSILNPP